MKRISDTSEILGTVELADGTYELCATADAGFDEESNKLVVRLDSFLRTSDLRTRERRADADWLPKPVTVTESVGLDEALEVSREIFHRWVRKLREAAPSLHGSTF